MRKLIDASVIAILALSMEACGTLSPKGSECKEYEQAKAEVGVTFQTASQLKVEGKVTQAELTKIDQDGALYSKRLHDLCNFLQQEKISFVQYEHGVSQAAADYQKIMELVRRKGVEK